MTAKSSGDRRPSRRRFRARARFAPRGSRTLVLGMCASVGGIAGAVRGAADGMGLLKVLGLLAIGVLGVLLTVGCVVNYAKER
ncbi:hypothetical protein ACFV8T_19885 [Streptomyces sp. NPDC059832]|uniref:hypothetical protein n=1 Tax=unclassified Streptomyces TaxID=2593676 RepID=UPI00365BE00B